MPSPSLCGSLRLVIPAASGRYQRRELPLCGRGGPAIHGHQPTPTVVEWRAGKQPDTSNASEHTCPVTPKGRHERLWDAFSLTSLALNCDASACGRRMTFLHGEQALSEWMAVNVSVSWLVHPTHGSSSTTSSTASTCRRTWRAHPQPIPLRAYRGKSRSRYTGEATTGRAEPRSQGPLA